MTKYHELQSESHTDRKRVGRGISSGYGKTAGRGTKGQGARTGKKLRPMFQGGQRALAQAVPKARGFKSLRTPAQVVYSDRIADVAGTTIDNKSLFEAGLIDTPYHAVKIIMRGDAKLTKKYSVSVQGMSKTAQKAVKDAGGTFKKVPTPLKPKKSSEK